ncbi:oligopeptide transporter, OPT family [Sphingomonas naphthae]|uniref:Oligopeptide transporter, OPT family n=1 Tax=Sphingomonas naphthae TaxID=1813468 RepID=A0ABY7THZ6_9SPHN|nr:oligopeptide transporter, OPT family [Sphingomonas naphthae]WCT72828.1 oligopeptide transporter, OPT family [Sphingomonas naphthae]
MSDSISRRLEPELTLRGLVLGAAITLLFTAANVYLGLRVGLTFATSIPAAVISMALLRMAKSAGILENNIVQTVASAAGTLSAVIFVVPGLVMVGWWAEIPFWQTFAICATGGLLGVLFSVPLRRALVTGTDLPFPEGVAAAEVLKVGVQSREGTAESKAGLKMLGLGTLLSGGYAILGGMKLVALEAAAFWRVGGAAMGTSFGFSMALVGAGHLVGLSVGLAMFAGLVIAFFAATPYLTWAQATVGPAAEAALDVWAHQVRFIGAGVIGITALYALAKLVAPIARGLAEAAAASRARKLGGGGLPVEEQDLPVGIVGGGALLLLLPIGFLLANFLGTTSLADNAPLLIGGALIFVLVVAAFVAAVCGYMAGLIGASNSPLSGVGILAIIAATLLLVPIATQATQAPLVAFALFVTAIVFASATIANDNLQDLKTGQLVGATPWKQQVALMLGVLAGAVVIPPILELLNKAYGFAGVPGANPATALGAPQAQLISALAKGVLAGDLDWSLIGAGGLLGIVLIAIDGALGKAGLMRLPPLAVGLGIYLPGSSTLAVTLGAVVGHLFEKRHRDEGTRRTGVLLASGLIVGESLFGVALAGLIVATGSGSPLAVVGEAFEGWAVLVGMAMFAAFIAIAYTRAGKRVVI